MKLTTIMLNFRASLIAVVPMAEQVRIAWRRPDSYDEWDAIASALFDQLVLEVIRFSLPEESREVFRLPSYDLCLESYESVSTLEVVHPSLDPGRWLFHAFGTEREPFDKIELRLLSEDGSLLSENIETCSVQEAGFRLRLGSHLVEELTLCAS